MADDESVETQWSDAAKATYEARAEGLIRALREHVRMNLTRVGRQRELEEYFASQTRLFADARAFVDAEFDWCGSVPLPLTSDEDDDWDDEDEDEDEDDEGGPGGVLTVFGRWDYRVTDPTALIEAGRRAYLQAWPDDEPEDAAVRIEVVEQAAGELMHGDDVSALESAPGVESDRYSITVLTHDGDDDFDGDPFRLAVLADHADD